MMDSSDILQLIDSELEHLRQRVQERVSEAARNSEAATLATGGILTRILHEARAQVDDLGALSARVSGADGDSAGQIAADTSREMRSFCAGSAVLKTMRPVKSLPKVRDSFM